MADKYINNKQKYTNDFTSYKDNEVLETGLKTSIKPN